MFQKSVFSVLSALVATTVWSSSSMAGANISRRPTAEPAYCDMQTFLSKEVKYNGAAPSRLHVFKLGKIYLAGMAVGNSKPSDVKGVSATYSNSTNADKFCTWYLNDGNQEAANLFNWRNLPRPSGSDYSGMSAQYMTTLGDQFDEASTNMVSCAVNHGYIGLGCDGMKHRGPTVLPMVLAYSGCSPAKAVAISNKLWGENGISVQMREAIAQKAYDLGVKHPDASKSLREAMQ